MAEGVIETMQDLFSGEPATPTPPTAEVQEAQEAQEAAPTEKAKSRRPIAIPRDSASFFRVRAKDPKMFQFTADGNLQVPEMRGQAAKIIDLPSYRPATIGEMEEGEIRRHDELVNVEMEYDEMLHTFKEAMEIWRSTGSSSEALISQRKLAELDNKRSTLRSPVRWTKEFKRLSIREVLTDEFYQKKKIGYSVYALRIRSIPFEDLVRLGELVKEEAESESESEAQEESFIFFSEPAAEHGDLSPDNMVEFIFNSTKYNSLTQAYEVERITKLGRRKDFGPILLKSRSPAQIRSLGSKIVGDVENPRELWIEILRAYVNQYPHYADVLRQTGSDTLVYANPKEGRWGIGAESTERDEWKGPNILGQAWQAVRTTLPEAEAEGEGDDAAAAATAAAPKITTGGYTEHGKTHSEATKQRSRVLMGLYRRH